jgi:2',3'-cyclic-nucleotide 2'-phosphodiesterase (5'-nucleotidase family)
MQTRFSVVFATLLLLAALAAVATTSSGAVLQPDKLVILSSTDVKGKTSPCGCHIPKGGLYRRAGLADSIRAQYGQVALVDAGGFLPEADGQQDLAGFLMDVMNRMNTDAVGVGERDLRYGVSFLRAQVKRNSLPVVCANLIDKHSRKPLFNPYLVKKIGGVKVGFFGLIGENVNLGPSRDSLLVEEPAAVATRTIAEMRKKGVDVVVMLGQLGKIENEDLVSKVDGVNALVVGGNAPIISKGRMIKNTVACYGGEQGHYLCKTVLTLDATRQVTSGEADAVMLGPEVRDQPEIYNLVKSFEDGSKEKLRKSEAESAARASKQDGGNR